MRYSLYINQLKSIEWGINLSQAAVFSHLYEVSKGSRYEFIISYEQLVSEIPAVVDKPDTAYRLLRKLSKKGLISLECLDGYAYFTILDKAKEWI